MIVRWKSDVVWGTSATARRSDSRVISETDWPSMQDAPAVELELAQEQRHERRLAGAAVADEADLLAARDREVEVAGEHATARGRRSGAARTRWSRARDHERHGPRPVDDLVRLQQLLQAFADLAVVAHGLGQGLAEEEHALLESSGPP